ncbi:MAG: winged helix-turn-helix domain-containing protein [Kangiellaceae bacterium]|nr:winged helix-turn-helix domain-containing protein [Kangiellaceae bacterium]
MVYQFGEFTLDTSCCEINFDGKKLDVEPLVFKLISYLIQERARLVTRQELFNKIWPESVVSEAALSNHIKNARKLLKDDGNRQQKIKTIHGLGYQFVYRTLEVSLKKIAVEPFENLRPCDKVNYFGKAISSHLISRLQQIMPLFPEHALTTFAMVETSVPDFLLTGNYIEDRKILRINIELVDLNNRIIAWRNHLETKNDGIFNLQDKVVLLSAKGLSEYLPSYLLSEQGSFSAKNEVPNLKLVH